MEEKNEVEKIDEVMLPGFRFHPTDEELVGFYLKRKVLQRPLSIELIKQLDIYKYDPWDLPKFAMAGEKEWYFFCPRDRKYRNSARPNRVTGAGFWKATGTDRPIYSSEGNKCIGLKKSLVFYRGRAAKGVKTDWMMHEFRLPGSVAAGGDHSSSSKKLMDNSIPITDSWAICRIFKKTNSTPHRALSHSFVSSSGPLTNTNKLNKDSSTPQFGSDNNTPHQQQTTSSRSCYSQFNQENIHTHQTSHVTTTAPPVSCLDFSSSYPMNHHQLLASPLHHQDLTNYLFAPSETQSQIPKCSVNDVSSLLQLNMPSPYSFLGDYMNQIDSLSSNIDFNSQLLEELQCPALVTFPQELQSNGMNDDAGKGNSVLMKNFAEEQYWETVRSVGFPSGLSENDGFNQDVKQNMEFFLPPWQLEI